ncbi:Dihydroxy-acid dehydratase [Pseudozyma hubeiensis]|nr:Dihydroxy-acid dehydratase [Pseudozyma hubeiensis]
MRFSLIALCASLVLAASSVQISAIDVASSSSSSALLLTRSDAASSVSSSNGNLSLAKRVDDATASTYVEEIDVEADDEDSSDDATLEGRARKHRHTHHRSKKHSGRRHRHKSHVNHKSKHSKTKSHEAYTASSSDGTYEGKGTFFSPNQGACGKWNKPSDKIVALSKDIYDDGSHCFDTVRICHKGKCADASVADLCPGCEHTSLDMTTSLFKELADLEVGVIDIQWSFV